MDLVDRHRDRDQLGLVVPALGEERADRPVDHARGQRRLLARFALATEERAGDLARGVHPLLDVDGEGKEVHVAKAADGCGAEHHRVAGLNHDRATRLLREFSGLEGDLAVADIRRDAGYVKHAHLVVLPPAARMAAICFQNSRSLSARESTGVVRGRPRGRAGDAGADAGLEVAPDPRRDRARSGDRPRSARDRARGARPAPRGAGRRRGRGRRRASRPSRRSGPAAPAASAAACRAGERGCLLATGKWRKTIVASARARSPPRRRRSAGSRGRRRRSAASPSPRTWSSGPTGGTAALVSSVSRG